MKIVVSIACLLFLFTGIAQSKRYQISGKVTTSEQGLENSVKVTIVNLNRSVRVEANGNFHFENIENGRHFLNIYCPGYELIKDTLELYNRSCNSLFYTFKDKIHQLPETIIEHASLTGGELGIRKMPGSAYYISPLEIQKFNYSDIHCVLKTIPGVNIQEEDGYGLRPNIGLRGSGVSRSSKITLMEDGILMAPAPYCAPAAYYFPTTGRMYAVEILKGSSQIKYGPFTTGGALNLISTPIPRELTAKLNIMGGSFWGRNIHGAIGNTHGNMGYMVETYSYGSNGFKILDNGGNTGFNKNDFLTKFIISSDKSAKIAQSLLIKAGYCQETSNETYVGLTHTDFQESPYRRYAASQKDVMNSSQHQISLSHTIKPVNWVNITTSIYRNDFNRNWYKLSAISDSSGNKIGISSLLSNDPQFNRQYQILTGESSDEGESLFVKGNNRSYFSQGIQSIMGFDFTTGKIKHDVQFGVRYHEDAMDRYQNEDRYSMNAGTMFQTYQGELGTESNRIRTANALASHIQYALSYNKLDVTTGIRYENIELNEIDYGKTDPLREGINVQYKSNAVSIFLPGIGINYSWDEKFSTYVGVHKGFAPPGLTEGSVPEESLNYEFGTKFFGNFLNFQTALFFNEYKNLLGNDLAATGGNGAGNMYNGGKAQTMGAEIFATINTIKLLGIKSRIRIPITVSYTFTDAQFLSSFESSFDSWGNVNYGDEFPYLSKHQFSSRLSLEHSKFEINLNAKYNSAMRAQAGSENLSQIEHIPSYMVFDGGVKYYLNKQISFNIIVQNITNQAYIVALRPAGLRPGLPRIIQFGISAKL